MRRLDIRVKRSGRHGQQGTVISGALFF